MTTKIKSAEHLEEIELNKLLKYLHQNKLWVYYLFVRLGVSVALRYSDLSQITWEMVLGKTNLILKEKKTGKVREIPLHIELTDTMQRCTLKWAVLKGGVVLFYYTSVPSINKSNYMQQRQVFVENE
jgi:integrase